MLELYACGFNSHGQLNLPGAKLSPATFEEKQYPELAKIAASRSRNLRVRRADVEGEEGNLTDVFEFRKLASGRKVEVFLADWGYNLSLVDDELFYFGRIPAGLIHIPKLLNGAYVVIAGFSDDPDESTPERSLKLHTIQPIVLDTGQDIDNEMTTKSANTGEEHSYNRVFTHLAVAGNDSVVIARWESTIKASIVLSFSYYQNNSREDPKDPSFLEWCQNPNLVPESKHTVPGEIVQLVSGSTSFAMLTAAGQVYTWGDVRYLDVLGRFPNSTCPAETPGPILDTLGGLKVTKIAMSGWMGAAVTEAGEGFIWGWTWYPWSSIRAKPKRVTLSNIRGLGAPRWPVPIQLEKFRRDEASDVPGTKRKQPETSQDGDMDLSTSSDLVDDEDILHNSDILDIALGQGHVLVIDSDGVLWAAGSNQHGQLGIGKRSSYEDRWIRVKLPVPGQHPRSVVCGDLTSFVIVDAGNGGNVGSREHITNVDDES